MAGPSFPARLWGLRRLQFSRPQKFALALLAAGLVATAALPSLLLARQWRYSTFMEVSATVTSVELAVDEAADGWLVRKEGAVTLDYTASGLPQSVTLAASRFDAEKLVVGNTVLLHVNPNKLGEVETEHTWHDILTTLLFTFGSAVMAILGWLLFRWLTPELAATEDDDGHIDDDDIFEPLPPRRRGER